MGFFSSKVNRSSTPAEQKFESNLSGEDKDNYVAMNHDKAVQKIAKSSNKGWHATQVGVTDPNWEG